MGEVTKIRKSKSNINFKSDLSPLYTIKKNDALSETKILSTTTTTTKIIIMVFMTDSKWNKGITQHLIVPPPLIYYFLEEISALKNWPLAIFSIINAMRIFSSLSASTTTIVLLTVTYITHRKT